MSTRKRNLILACAWSTIAVSVAAATDGGPLRLVLAAPLVLFLPGYALLAALQFSSRSAVDQCVLAAGSSIALAVVGGFVLDALHMLNPFGWAAWCASVVVMMSGVAIVRGLHLEERVPVAQWNIRLRHVVVLGVAALMIGGALILSARDEAKYRQFKYTELWMSAKEQAAGEIIIGVTSAEADPRIFDIEVTLGGRSVATWRSLRLEPGQTLIRQFVPPSTFGRAEKAEAWLVNSNNRRQVYRKVSLWIDGSS